MNHHPEGTALVSSPARSAFFGEPKSGSHWRYERKFTIHGWPLAAVLAQVRRHPAVFHQAYPSRVINNVYFDSPSLDDYRDHVSGTAHRVKTRIRWYGPLRGAIDHPMLEHKIKRGLVNRKQCYPLPPLHLNGSIDRNALEAAYDRAGLPDPVRSRLRHLQPALINRYQRHYFQSADRRFRLTVDAELDFHSANRGAASATATPNGGDLIILELKFDPRHAEAAEAVTNAIPFRLNRCSKYVLGIAQVHVT
jgi:hypothetical protein